MLRRVVSSTALTASPATAMSAATFPTLRRYSDSMDGEGSNNNSNNGNNSRAAAAGRAMCDTADGVYAAMLMRSSAAASSSPAATQPVGSRRIRNHNRSIFGDSPAAVATSLMGCFFFATTYGYYIGGAVKEAAAGRFGAATDGEEKA